jgi:hypothetical protein
MGEDTRPGTDGYRPRPERGRPLLGSRLLCKVVAARNVAPTARLHGTEGEIRDRLARASRPESAVARCQGRDQQVAAGVSLFTLSRRMGTSLAMIDQTYGHLAPDAEEQERMLLDDYDTRTAAGSG